MRWAFWRWRVGCTGWLVTLAACGASEQPGSTTFVGAFAGGSEVGRFEAIINVAPGELEGEAVSGAPAEPEPAIAASGTLEKPGPSRLSLVGNYDRPAKTLYLAGGQYVFGGCLEHEGGYSSDDNSAEGAIEGTYFGPLGTGLLYLYQASTGSVAVLCGGFHGSISGTWAVVLGGHGGNAIAASAIPDKRRFHFSVSVAGRQLSFTEEETDEPVTASATGTLSAAGDSATGAWELGAATGSWQASTRQCVS